MPSLADLTRTFAAEDLDPALAKQLEPLFRYLNANFGAIKDAIGGGLLGIADNLFCEIVTAGFTHNTAQYIGLRKLQTAAAALVLRADGQAVVAAPEVVMSGDRKAKVTLRFNDPTATNVSVVLLILTEGNGARATAAVWADPILKSLLTTTGDLIYASAASTPARLAAPADGTYSWKYTSGVPSLVTASGSGVGTPAGAALWVKPTSPDARDEEFEGTLAAWTDIQTRSGSAVDPYASFTTANTFRDSCNSFWPGWYVHQSTSTQVITGIYKAVTMSASNDLIWWRWRQVLGSTNHNFANATHTVIIGNSFAGDAATTAYFGINVNDSGGNPPSVSLISSPGNVHLGVSDSLFMARVEYGVIHKIGTTYHAWAINADGSERLYLGSKTIATAMATLSVYGYNNNPTTPGNPFFGVDFVRWIANTTTALP